MAAALAVDMVEAPAVDMVAALAVDMAVDADTVVAGRCLARDWVIWDTAKVVAEV